MHETETGATRSMLDRMARVAFTFVVMNYSAVAGAIAALARRRVWR